MVNVSIIIRTKNEGRFLAETLSAVYRQSLAPSEVIIVDSGSTDHTIDIAHRFGTRLIQIPPESFTYGHALNVGCAAACGEVLVSLTAHACPVDSDWLRNLTAALDVEKGVVAAFGGQTARMDADAVEAIDIARAYGPNGYVSNGPNPPFSNVNSAFYRSTWEEEPFDETLPIAEDLEWAQRVGRQQGLIAYVPTAGVLHSHSYSLHGVYRRYSQEAIALRRVRGASKGFWRLVLGCGASIVRDAARLFITGHARSVAHLIAYRCVQHYATWRGGRGVVQP